MLILIIIGSLLLISVIITAVVVFLVSRSNSKDYYDEAEFGKTKEFDPNIFFNDDGSEEELSRLDSYEVEEYDNDNRLSDIQNKFNSISSSKDDLLELEKTSQDLELDLGMYFDNNEEEELI